VFDDLEDQLQIIFEDDGYRMVDDRKERLKQGDLVTYWMPQQPKPIFLHIGMIFEIRPGVSEDSPGIPWVLSKLDSTSGEVLHHYHDVTFIEGVNHEVRFVTNRPNEERKIAQ
jgi:hypothetical protein